MLVPFEWKKCEAGHCPEAYYHPQYGVVLFRDSDDPSQMMQIKVDSWKEFVKSVKNDEWDILP